MAMRNGMALQINGITVNNTPFASREAEGMVQQMRRNLELETTAKSQDRPEDARRHREAAENLYKQIQARVVKRLIGYAHKFYTDDKGLQEDVLVEMLVRLRLRLLGEVSQSHYFGEQFNDAVKMLSIDAFRCVARENDRSIKTGRPNQDMVSLNEPISEEDDAGEDHIASLIDPEALMAVERLLDRDFAQYAMKQLPSNLHRAIYSQRTRGDEWKTIALVTGVSIRTAQTRFKEAEKIIVEVGGKFNEENET